MDAGLLSAQAVETVVALAPVDGSSRRTSWSADLPVLQTKLAVLREVSLGDADSLSSWIRLPAVRQYLSSGPTSEKEFVRFIHWARHERRAGRHMCFAVLPHSEEAAAGVFQLWPVEPGCGTAEMGFVLKPAFWGTGMFIDAATGLIDFAIDDLNVRRLEFRSAVANTRAAAALLKLGAVPEGTLRQCFLCAEGLLDHTIWSILADDWRQRNVRRRTQA